MWRARKLLTVGNRPSRRRAKAFTLLEVMIALAIVAVTIPAFLRVVQGSVSAGKSIESAGRQQLALEGAINYIESFLGRLPTDIGFVFQKDGDGSRFIAQNVYCAPGEPMLRRQGWNTQIDVRRAANGTNSVVALCLPQDLNTALGDPPPALTLLNDVETVAWRFYVKEAGSWVEEIPDGVRPAMIELKIALADESILPRMVFWLRPRAAGLYDN
jgi:prepilin-type N-terminal cleavage/methylation domain-containing protein